MIVGAWAAYLVPMWLRRQDELNEARPTERFSTAIRLLTGRSAGRRSAGPDDHDAAADGAGEYSGEYQPGAADDGSAHPDAAPAPVDRRGRPVDVRAAAVPATGRYEAPDGADDAVEPDGSGRADGSDGSGGGPLKPPAPGPQQPSFAERRARAKVLARRRRTTTLLFVALTIGAIAAATGGARYLWAVLVPALLLTAYIVRVRGQERRRYAYQADEAGAQAAARRVRERAADREGAGGRRAAGRDGAADGLPGQDARDGGAYGRDARDGGAYGRSGRDVREDGADRRAARDDRRAARDDRRAAYEDRRAARDGAAGGRAGRTGGAPDRSGGRADGADRRGRRGRGGPADRDRAAAPAQDSAPRSPGRTAPPGPRSGGADGAHHEDLAPTRRSPAMDGDDTRPPYGADGHRGAGAYGTAPQDPDGSYGSIPHGAAGGQSAAGPDPAADRRALVEQTDHAEWVDQERSGGRPEQSGWDPVPVPLPTYVTAPVAPRATDGVDLGAPDTWSSARSSTVEPQRRRQEAEEAAEAKEADEAGRRRPRERGRTPLFDQYADPDRKRAANE